MYKVIEIRDAGTEMKYREVGLVPIAKCDDLTFPLTYAAMDCVQLLEQNKGKAGALNVCLGLLRAKAKQWCEENNLDSFLIQVIMGILDARHMFAESDVFWNLSLPYFSCLETGASAISPSSLAISSTTETRGTTLCGNY